MTAANRTRRRPLRGDGRTLPAPASTGARRAETLLITRERLAEYLKALAAACDRPGRLYLIGETSQLFEGWREWVEAIEVTGEAEREQEGKLSEAIQSTAVRLGVAVIEESPADVIPLPAGYRERAIPIVSPSGTLDLFHFDPYSVAYRFIARGDEPDYHLVLMYLRHGWLHLAELDARLGDLLPRFTSETIQQDPAEFRRRYKGLKQMAEALPPRTVHRHTEA